MEVNSDFQTQRIARLNQHLANSEMVLKAPSYSTMSIGFEEKLNEYKITADTLINLADDRISKGLEVFKNSLAEQIALDLRGLKGVGAIIKDALNTYHTYVERQSYLIDQSDLELLRLPVTQTYGNVFKVKSALIGDEAVSDFSQCLDFADIKETINRSEWIGYISPIFFSNNAKLQFGRMSNLLTAIDNGLRIQSTDSGKMILGFLNMVKNGKGIIKDNQLDLNKESFMFLGTDITSTVIVEIRRVWYQSNQGSKLNDIVNDTTVALTDPIELFTPNNELKDDAIDHLITNLSLDEVFLNLTDIQQTSISIVNRISLNIELLRAISEQLIKVPTEMKETQYCYQVMDVAKLITLYSEQLSLLLDFINQLNKAIIRSVSAIRSLSTVLSNHRQSVMTYINKRNQLK